MGIFIFCFFSALSVVSASPTSKTTCKVLNLLHVVPFPDNSSDAGWDKGWQVIPAGLVAVEHINKQYLLKPLKLQIINVPSRACNYRSPLKAYVEILRLLTETQLACVFGFVGLYCSSVVNTIAPPFSHHQFGYIQLSSATSPFLENKHKFPYLFRVLSSSDVYNEAVFAMMAAFGWKKASVVYDYDTLFYRNNGASFTKMALATSNFTLLDSFPFFITNPATEALFHITSRRSRINYLSMTIADSRKILCAAYKHNLVWPRFVYIFFDRYLEEILKFEGYCPTNEVIAAVEGAFFLLYNAAVKNENVLVSGVSYQQYLEEYWNKSRQYAPEGISRDSAVYGNTLYDQIWAFALAWNKSMGSIDIDVNGTLKQTVSTLPRVRQVLADQLQLLSFQGASGRIQFGENREVQTIIDIFQVQNGALKTIAVYNSTNKKVDITETFDMENLPSDSILIIHYKIHWSVVTLTLIVVILILVGLVVSTVAFIYWRNKAVIRSTSLNLSLVLLSGCLLLCIVPIIDTSNQLVNGFVKLHTVVCNAHYWIFFSGISIITSTLLFRLLRIFKIFHSYHSTGKYWSDKFLLLYIAQACSGTVGILMVWASSDPMRSVQIVLHRADSYDLVYNYCRSDNLSVWLGLLYVWIGLQFVVIIFLAIQTRHIQRNNFKDTKKINIFITFIAVSYALLFPLSYIFEELELILPAYLARSTFFLLTLTMTQMLLFWPKYLPLMFPRLFQSSKDYTLTEAFKKIIK